MHRIRGGAIAVAACAFAVALAGCGSSSTGPSDSGSSSSAPMSSSMPMSSAPDSSMSSMPMSSAPSSMSQSTSASGPFGAACSSVPKSGKGSFSGMSGDPVATAASNNPVLSTLVTAVKKAGLVDTLNNTKNITVFAPANSAFAKIPASTLNSVLANKTQLTKLLELHVVPGKLAPSELAGSHKTLAGSSISVTGSGTSFKVNGQASVVCGNVTTSNATVYIIDSVLMPQSTTASGPFGAACSMVPKSGKGSFSGMSGDPVATAASNNPVLSTLVTAVTKAGLGDTLNNTKDITVFAPANSAFAKIPKSTLNSVLSNKTELTKLLELHVVPGKLSPSELAGSHKTLAGSSISVTGSGTSFKVNGQASVVCGNVTTSNATVYIIDSVLMPK